MKSVLHSSLVEIFKGNVHGFVGPADPRLVMQVAPFTAEKYLDKLEAS